MWTIEKTDASHDIHSAFDWYQEAPKMLRSFSVFFDKYERPEFTSNLLLGYNYAGRKHNEINCLIHAEIKSENLVEGHLFCGKDADIDLVAATINYARVDLLKTYGVIVCHVMKKHRTLNKIMDMSAARWLSGRGVLHPPLPDSHPHCNACKHPSR